MAAALVERRFGSQCRKAEAHSGRSACCRVSICFALKTVLVFFRSSSREATARAVCRCVARIDATGSVRSADWSRARGAGSARWWVRRDPTCRDFSPSTAFRGLPFHRARHPPLRSPPRLSGGALARSADLTARAGLLACGSASRAPELWDRRQGSIRPRRSSGSAVRQHHELPCAPSYGARPATFSNRSGRDFERSLASRPVIALGIPHLARPRSAVTSVERGSNELEPNGGVHRSERVTRSGRSGKSHAFE
jgi:hypothetical protein